MPTGRFGDSPRRLMQRIVTVPDTSRRITMKKGRSRKARSAAAVGIGLVTVLAGTALALSNIALKLGTGASYDFGGYGPGYRVPGTVQIHAFTMNPGDSIPWHYHKGVSFVMLEHGSLTEQHLVGANHCDAEERTARARVRACS